MLLALVYCFLTALAYAYYPVLARKIGLNAMWLGIFVMAGGLIPIGIWNIFQVNSQKLTMKQVLLGILVGVIGGVGTIFYSKIMTMQNVNLSAVVPIMLAMMPIILAVISYFVLGEQLFTVKKISALLMVSISIFLMTS